MHGDFSDVFAGRSTNFAMLCSGSVQVRARVQTAQWMTMGFLAADTIGSCSSYRCICIIIFQEVMDSAAIAHMAALKGSYPFVHFYEGFHVSHQINTVEELPYDTIRSLLDDKAIQRTCLLYMVMCVSGMARMTVADSYSTDNLWS